MSGGGQSQGSTQGTNAGSAAQAASTAGTAGAGVNSLPQWQKGLLGAMTGSPQYGQNAPLVHQLMGAGMGALTQPTNAAPQMPHPMQRPMGGMAPPPGMPNTAAPQMPSAPPGLGMAPPGGMPPGAPAPQGQMQMQGQQPQISPQMLAMLRQQYPTMFGGQ